MLKKKAAVLCAGIFLAVMTITGCGSEQTASEETTSRQEETGTEGEKDLNQQTGQGFRPPKGSRVDSNGNIVDKEGNTFSKDGGWQVPEGGHVDAQGRIIDKNGNVMGGGARIGSKG